MRKFFSFMAGCALSFSIVNSAFAYTIDGKYNDWGFTPFTQWKPSSASVAYTVENNTNHYGTQPIQTSPFREERDLEALYLDRDQTYLYFALVSSVPFNNPSVSPRPEDIGLDFNKDGKYEFALDLAYINPIGPNAVANPVSKDVYSVTQWTTESNAPYQVAQGNVIGTYELVNRYLGNIEPGVAFPNTYLLEGRIALSMFGDASFSADITMFLAKYECITDYISVTSHASGAPVPEPASLTLLGSALVGLVCQRRQRSH